MELIPVNGEALKRAMEAVSGLEVAALTLKAYAAIDQAMHFAAQQVRAEWAANATKAYEEGRRQSSEDAWEAGYAKGLDDADQQEAYDNGYMDGVEDARVDPEEADDYIEYLCSLDDQCLDDDFDYLEPKVNAAVEGDEWYDDQPDTADFENFRY